MKRLILAAIALAGGMFLLEVTLGQRPDRRNYEYAPDMARSAAYKAQSANPFFTSGLTQQAPAPGTIARGETPLHLGAAPASNAPVPGGTTLQSPFTSEHPADLKRGQVVFDTYCHVCHGAAGAGDGPVTQRGFPAPPSLLLDHARTLEDGQIFFIITFGFKNMPAYAPQIEPADRWQAVAYVRKLQENQP